MLLEGPTGIGKSELIRATAARLKLQCTTLDLSLLEPPDLIGLPTITDGRTTYATPTILPTDGRGILLLEELNRAEKYMQQPALQLLTTGRLHEYKLPEGWLCVAATNPPQNGYHVHTLDPALIARFLFLRVVPDRGAWLDWAEQNAIEPVVIAVVRQHERAFDQVCPRSWTYAAQILATLTPGERQNNELLFDVLSGYLPPAWTEAVINQLSSASSGIGIDVRSVLRSFSNSSPEGVALRELRDRGRTDAIDEFVQRLRGILRSPEVAVLHGNGGFVQSAFEDVLRELPGDSRELLQDALSENPVAVSLVDLRAADVLVNATTTNAVKKLTGWARNPLQRYRVDIVIRAIVAHLKQHTRATDYRQNNALRSNLGLVLSCVGERSAMPLVHTLLELGITPIKPR